MSYESEQTANGVDASIMCVRDNPDSGVPWHQTLQCGPGGRDGSRPINFYACPSAPECQGRRMRDNPEVFVGTCALDLAGGKAQQ